MSPGDRGWLRDNWYRDVWLLLITALVLWAAYSSYNASDEARRASDEARLTAIGNRGLIVRIETEGVSRRDETCRIFEREQRARVNALAGTYQYLAQLSPEEAGATLNRFIIVNLPQTERQARASSPPSYCEDPGVGLPGPPPKVPARPAAVERLVVRQGR